MKPAPKSASAGRRAAALLAVAAAAAGCVAVAGRPDLPEPVFTHGAHATRDLDCSDCHDKAKSAEHAGMPGLDMCEVCHEGPDLAAPIATAIARYRERPEDARYLVQDGYGDVIFAHAAHAAGEAKIDCERCHPGARSEPRASPQGQLSMDECIACHQESGGGPTDDCAGCHRVIGKETPPANHRGGWLLRHGGISRLTTGDLVEERCEMCHTRSQCDQCHLTEAPVGHGVAFRTFTHGIEAGFDRDRCLACHKTDFCEACHLLQPPRSHVGAAFGSPVNAHCNGACHLPAADNACVTCHRGAPSHRLAPPRPNDQAHATARLAGECLQCHLILSHPTGGEECLACHQ